MALGETFTQRLKGCLLRAEGFQAAARSVEIVPHKSISLMSRQEQTTVSEDQLVELKPKEAQTKLAS